METKKIALIPAYQPLSVLPELIKQLHALGLFVVVVNDGSGNDYEDIFKKCEPYAVLLRHEKNRGKGSALKTGLQYIERKYGEDCTVVTVDADGQHCAADALAVLQIAEQQPSAMILGSRFLEKNAPLRSRFGNSITRAVFYLLTKRRIYDTQTGLRAFSGSLIPALSAVRGERYEYEMNVLLQLAENERTIVEHRIETIYSENNASSHFHTVTDSFRIYRELFKYAFSSFLGFLTDYAVYSLLLLCGADLLASNIIARVISASVNFTINRRFVFQSRDTIPKTAVRYFILAAAVLFGNTCFLSFFVNQCGVNQLLAKLLTECCFFFLSYAAQRRIVFQDPSGGSDVSRRTTETNALNNR